MNYDWLLTKSRWLWGFFIYAKTTKYGSIEVSHKIPLERDVDTSKHSVVTEGPTKFRRSREE